VIPAGSCSLSQLVPSKWLLFSKRLSSGACFIKHIANSSQILNESTVQNRLMIATITITINNNNNTITTNSNNSINKNTVTKLHKIIHDRSNMVLDEEKQEENIL
jgi:hypothetical protein